MLTITGATNQEASLEQVKAAKPPDGDFGYQWKPVPHGEMVDALLSEFGFRGWKVSRETYYLTPDGEDLAASFNLSIPTLDAPPGTALSLGVLNCNSRLRAVRLYCGLWVPSAGYGVAVAEIPFKKHTTGLNVHAEVDEGVNAWTTQAVRMQKEVMALQNLELDDDEATLLLASAARGPRRRQLMPWSWVGVVDEEFRKEPGGTGWKLLCLFAKTARRNAPLLQMEQVARFRATLPAGRPKRRPSLLGRH